MGDDGWQAMDQAMARVQAVRCGDRQAGARGDRRVAMAGDAMAAGEGEPGGRR